MSNRRRDEQNQDPSPPAYAPHGTSPPLPGRFGAAVLKRLGRPYCLIKRWLLYHQSPSFMDAHSTTGSSASSGIAMKSEYDS
jgi:hypothetical protein